MRSRWRFSILLLAASWQLDMHPRWRVHAVCRYVAVATRCQGCAMALCAHHLVLVIQVLSHRRVFLVSPLHCTCARMGGARNQQGASTAHTASLPRWAGCWT